MADQPYKRPPITEAIIQITFAGNVSGDDLSKANNILARLYPHHQDVRNVDVAVDITGGGTRPRAEVQNQEDGHRRSSDDQTQVVVLWPTSFVLSQLAPYPGWDEIFGRFDRDWTQWKRVVSYHKIARVGVRYVNRIDIPVTAPVIEYEKYLNVYPHVPDKFGSNQAYAVQVRFALSDLGCNLTINSSSVPSPLLNHASFVLDQDIIREVDVPQSDEALYKLLGEIHLRKNEVFEDCITDMARELFGA